jgi:hypothetical protein
VLTVEHPVRAAMAMTPMVMVLVRRITFLPLDLLVLVGVVMVMVGFK